MQDNVLAKVRALLAKAESTDFPAEAEALNAKAADLVAKYGIDQALLTAEGGRTDKVIGMKVVIDDPYSMDKAILLCAIAKALRCRGIQHGRRGRVAHVNVLGHESDLERVELLYTSLLLQATTQVVRQYPPNPLESVAAYRRSWLAGFTIAVGKRLTAAEQRATAEAATAPGRPSTELVLADRSALVNQAVEELYPGLKTTTRTLGGSGARNGYVAGERADLGGTRVGNGRRAALR